MEAHTRDPGDWGGPGRVTSSRAASAKRGPKQLSGTLSLNKKGLGCAQGFSALGSVPVLKREPAEQAHCQPVVPIATGVTGCGSRLTARLPLAARGQLAPFPAPSQGGWLGAELDLARGEAGHHPAPSPALRGHFQECGSTMEAPNPA
ncbi:hypothetical protein GHT09_016537 [Marmota monax]|uniref:Uncharacterized protein n=1 Tax=Marmota monax TaxID=9995 RepID=A0A834Q571_MARMO|nr:hypothetical protein GHT09_016537 [Marmota monax]